MFVSQERGVCITLREVDVLVQFDRNSRTHSEAQVAQIAASIKQFGFTNPVLIDETNTIIAGEGRVLAAKKLKMESVPCIVLAGLTAVQKAAYVIADNKLALNSAWDTAVLAAELACLAEQSFDFSLTGFSEVEIIEFSVDLGAEPGASPSSEGPPAGGPDEKDWSGMPDFEQPSDPPYRTLLVHFNDQAAVDAFAVLIGQHLTDKTKYVWVPKQKKTARTGDVYA